MASATSALAAPKLSENSPPPTPVALSKPVVFATSGLGGMIGWVIVHPANTTAGECLLPALAAFSFAFHCSIHPRGN